MKVILCHQFNATWMLPEGHPGLFPDGRRCGRSQLAVFLSGPGPLDSEPDARQVRITGDPLQCDFLGGHDRGLGAKI